MGVCGCSELSAHKEFGRWRAESSTEDSRGGQSGSWLYSVFFTVGRGEIDFCAEAEGAEGAV